MNNKAHLDVDVIKIIYYKYQVYVVPVIAFVVSWFIFFQFVMPQVNNFLTVKDQVAVSEQTLAVMTQNYNTLVSLNTAELATDTSIVNQALPQVKDFAGILNAISAAAAASGVSVNDYSFQIGDINSIIQASNTNAQTVQLALTIVGNIAQTKEFLKSLSLQLPLSEAVLVSITGKTGAAITANFYYSVASKKTFIDTNPLPVLNSVQKKLLHDLVGNAATQVSENTNALVTPSVQFTPLLIGSGGAH